VPPRNFALDNSPSILRVDSSTSGQMVKLKDDYEQARVQTLSELDPLICRVQHDVEIPTKKEARTARAQFLALCWSLFLIGWTDGSTGPLLPRIQIFYHVGHPPTPLTSLSTPLEFCRLGSEQCLGYSFWDARSVVLMINAPSLHGQYLEPFSGRSYRSSDEYAFNR